MDLKIGDLVFLKSGGPMMTINSLLQDGGVQAVWHLKDGSLMREGFFPGALTCRHDGTKSNT